MDDKKNDVPEYKFADSEGVSEQPVENSNPAHGEILGHSDFNLKNIAEDIIEKIKNNLHKVIMFGAIVLIVALVYGISSIYSAKKTHEAEQAKVQAQNVDSAEQKMLITSQSTVVTNQPSLPVFSNNNQKIDTVENEISNNRKEFVKLRDAISDNQEEFVKLRGAISKTQQDVSNVDQNINQLTMAIQQLLTEVQQLKSKKILPKKKTVKSLVVYHIRAIVPGRVWLESADGRSITLRVGDNLDGYGKVDAISPRDGIVTMSNGSIIQYGVNDF